MRFHSTIILAALLASCAAPPAQRGWPSSAGWQAGSSSGSSAAARSRRASTPPPAAKQEPAVYQVASDGTVGCADPKALHLLQELRDSDKGTPRALAQAHREGHCMTVFRVSRWKLESSEGETVRLNLLDPGPHQRATTLYFLRNEVEPQS